MQKKMFAEPKMTKCEKPLDKVTMGVGCYRPGKGQGGPGGPGKKPTMKGFPKVI